MRTLLGVGPHHDQIRPTALNVIPGCRRPRLVAWPKGNVLPISRLGFICRHDEWTGSPVRFNRQSGEMALALALALVPKQRSLILPGVGGPPATQ